MIEGAGGFAKEEQGENVCLLKLGLATQGERRCTRSPADYHVNLVFGQGIAGHDVETGIDRAPAGKNNLSGFHLKLTPLKSVPAADRLDPASQAQIFCRTFPGLDLPHQFD